MYNFGIKSCVSLRKEEHGENRLQIEKWGRNYGDARNKNYVFFGDSGLAVAIYVVWSGKGKAGRQPTMIFTFLAITPVLVNIVAPNFQEMLKGSRWIVRENMKLKY